MVEVGRHTNIELDTLNELQDITGDEGNFTVSLLKKPRYDCKAIYRSLSPSYSRCLCHQEVTLEVDANCDGCVSCVDGCPFKAVTLMEFMKEN